MSNKKQTKKFDKKKENIFAIEKERGQLLLLLTSETELVEGSFGETLFRCGTPGCHCQSKPIHPATRLCFWENGKLKSKLVRVSDRAYIKKLSDNHKAHKQALRNLIKLNKTEYEALKALIKLKAIKYV